MLVDIENIDEIYFFLFVWLVVVLKYVFMRVIGLCLCSLSGILLLLLLFDDEYNEKLLLEEEFELELLNNLSLCGFCFLDFLYSFL